MSSPRERKIREVIIPNLDKFRELQEVHNDWWTARAKFFNWLRNEGQLEENDFYIYKMIMSYLSDV